jgi:hypothetical protein
MLPCQSGFTLFNQTSRSFNSISDTGTRHEVGCRNELAVDLHHRICFKYHCLSDEMLMQCLPMSVGLCRLYLFCSWAAQ